MLTKTTTDTTIAKHDRTRAAAARERPRTSAAAHETRTSAAAHETRTSAAAARAEFLRDDAGTPLGARAGGSGRPLREDGQSHYDAWLAQLRREACAYCGAPGGTVDHVEPRSRTVRGLGSAHGWVNVVGACCTCNQAKRDLPLLEFLRRRVRR